MEIFKFRIDTGNRVRVAWFPLSSAATRISSISLSWLSVDYSRECGFSLNLPNLGILLMCNRPRPLRR